MKPPSLPVLQGIHPDRPNDSEIHFDTLAPDAKIKNGKNLFHKKPSRKRKGNLQKRQMYTQILSKNEFVINAEGEELEGRERKQKTNGHGKHGEKKGKTGGTTFELPTNTPALSKKPNKSEAKTQ